MTTDDIETLFTRSDGSFLFARWGRPIVPVVFGVELQSLPIIKGAIEAVVLLAGHRMAETDPELGANLDGLVPELPHLINRLQAAEANQYRIFRFDPSGAIRACFSFVRLDEHLAAASADALALSQAVHMILLWSDRAFGSGQSALAVVGGGATIMRPEVAGVIRAAYDPALPPVSQDAALALRIAARVGTVQ